MAEKNPKEEVSDEAVAAAKEQLREEAASEAKKKAEANRERIRKGDSGGDGKIKSLRMTVLEADELEELRAARQMLELTATKAASMQADYNLQVAEVLKDRGFPISSSGICMDCGTVRAGGSKSDKEHCPNCR